MIIEIEKIKKFILSHKQKDDGFSFSKETPSTIEDTYFALQTFYELNIPYKEEDTFEFIKSIDKNNLLIKHIYQISEINKAYKLNISWLKDIIKKQTLPKKTESLETLYYFVKIDEVKKFRKKDLKNLNLEYLKISNDETLLSNLCYKTIILKKAGFRINERKIIEQIQRFQRNDGGFSFTKESMPCFIEQIYLAVETLAELNAKPKDVNNCVKLIQSFKANNGSYGRQVFTVPSLEATYYAVFCLKRLKE